MKYFAMQKDVLKCQMWASLSPEGTMEGKAKGLSTPEQKRMTIRELVMSTRDDEMLGSVRYELKRKFVQSPPPSHISEARPSHSAAFSSFRTSTWREFLATAFTPLDPVRQDVDWPTRFVDHII